MHIRQICDQLAASALTAMIKASDVIVATGG
jgi:hypothetical protein